MKNEIVKINPVIMDLVHSSQIELRNPFTEEIFLVDILVALKEQSPMIREHVDALSSGDELIMVRTEGLKIWLMHNDVVIGEVPLECSVIIARLMDAGKKLKCKVSTAGTHSHKCFKTPFSRILAKIYMID